MASTSIKTEHRPLGSELLGSVGATVLSQKIACASMRVLPPGARGWREEAIQNGQGLSGMSGLGWWCQEMALDSDTTKAGEPLVWPQGAGRGGGWDAPVF